ncbi:MAG: helix-hairpin-helix domain-containing protein [Gemmatimonadota bacterium]|nr:helix-hairpin-helix domain-containing protein [Gemmatimonadota bacterium]MDH3426979.1 helix-hairpin-helix domain-containing protein [Gemmatimonadota bacterium]
MSRISRIDRRALVSGTCLIVLGTVVRLVLAPDPAALEWQPGGSDRAARTLSEIRVDVDSALDSEAEAARPLEPGERIDLNAADESSLRRLPGIGVSRAVAIQRDRALRGPYRSVSDLSRVPGIGARLIERLEPHVRLEFSANSVSSHRTSGRLDLNRAQINELEQITGIGPSLAGRIVDVRTRNGGFKQLDELSRIPGIGPKTMKILADEVFVR